MKKYTVNPKTIYKVFEDEVHILDHKTATIHSLNQTASFIWMQLLKPTTKSALVKKIEDEFDVSREKLEKDVDRFLEKYLKNDHILVKGK